MDITEIIVMSRGAERLLIILAAAMCIYFGYLLYNGKRGRAGRVSMRGDLPWVGKFLMSGAGPGLGFMAVGAFVLLFALFKGGAVLQLVERADGTTLPAVIQLSSVDSEVVEKMEKFSQQMASLERAVAEVRIVSSHAPPEATAAELAEIKRMVHDFAQQSESLTQNVAELKESVEEQGRSEKQFPYRLIYNEKIWAADPSLQERDPTEGS